jgi:protease I
MASNVLAGKKVGVLMESDFYEPEIFYYQHRFAEAEADIHFLTNLWGQAYLTFKGHEQHYPIEVHESFVDMPDDELKSYDVLIVPGGMVSDRLRYSPDPANELSPAVKLLQRAFEEPSIIKGINCHGMWLMSYIPQYIKGRRAVVHNNLYADLINMGGVYVNEDAVVDADLVTGRSGGHCHIFVRTIINQLMEREGATA